MKSNLVKILALSAMVLSLGACGGNKPKDSGSESGSQEQQAVEKTIDEVLALDADNKFELLGQKIRIENLVLQGNYGLTYVGGAAVSEYTTGLRGLEIRAKEAPTFSKGSGWGSDISAEGTLIDVGGRAVLDQAVITVNSEREYNEAKTSYTGGLPVYMWPAQYMDRGAWDQYFGRKMSGVYFGGQFEVASVPAKITAEQGSSFQIVFPGEYADLEDPDNNSLITVQIPAGIPAAVVETINTFIDGLAVGDYIDIDSVTQYDLEANGGMGIVVERFGGQTIAESETAPVIHRSWAEVAAIAQELYADPLPNMTSTKPFTYKVDTSYATTAVSDLFKDTSWIANDNLDDAVFVQFDLICKPSEVYDDEADSDLFRECCADFEAAGFEKDEANSEAGGFIYTLTLADKCVATALVMAADGYVEMYYIADPLVLEADNFAGIKGIYENRVSKRLNTTFTSGLVDAATAGASYTLDVKNEQYFKNKYGDDLYCYDIVVSYENLPSGLDEAYETALLGAGFEAKLLSSYNAKGFYNATTKEFVIGIGADATKKQFTVEVFVFGPQYPVATDVQEIPETIETFAEAVAAYEEAANAAIGTITGTAGTLGSALVGPAQEIATYTINADNASVYADYYADLGLIVSVAIVGEFLDGVDAQTALTALLTALAGAGFVEGNFGLLQNGAGYWNATTNEFVKIQANSAMFMLSIYVLDATSAANVTVGA